VSLIWKTIHIASSDSLFEPYKNLSDPISPNFREAPTLTPSPNGKAWYMYYEQYPGASYGLSVADSLSGPWYQIFGYTFSLPGTNILFQKKFVTAHDAY
jgi:hypothetical protein